MQHQHPRNNNKVSKQFYDGQPIPQSRRVEVHEEDRDLPARERDTTNPADDPTEFGSAGEMPGPSENVNSPLDEWQAIQISETVVRPSGQAPPARKVQIAPCSCNKCCRVFFQGIKSDLASIKSDVKSELTQVKSELQAHQEEVRADIQAENQELLHNLEAQTQGL
jgi:hypothetical protein